jgi:hypothetical protein
MIAAVSAGSAAGDFMGAPAFPAALRFARSWLKTSLCCLTPCIGIATTGKPT